MSSTDDSALFDGVIAGVRSPRRLKAVADANLAGHLGDPDLDAVVATLRLACVSPMAVVNIVGADRQTYAAEVGLGTSGSSLPDPLSFCAEVVETGRAVIVPDAASHAVYSQNPLVLGGVVGAYAGVPLVDTGIVLGSVAIFDSGARVFSTDVLDILGHQGRLAGAALARRRAGRDALTGLPNRSLYADRLAGALARLERGRGVVCVMYLDIDSFKNVNDTFGHGGGDDVLVELAARLTSVLRPTDTLARFGGDEFVVLCEGLTDVDEAERLAARLVAATSERWYVDGGYTSVHVSIGVAVTDNAGTPASALVGDADRAMYLAKRVPGSATVLAPRRWTGP